MFRKRLEGVSEFGCGLEPKLGIALDRFHKEAGRALVEVRSKLARIAPGGIEMAQHGLQGLRLLPWQTARDRLVGGHAKREEIDSVVGGHALDQLGRQVVRRASPVPRPAELRTIGNAQAEIDQFYDALLIDHDVSRADVPVQETPLVHVFEGFRGLY